MATGKYTSKGLSKFNAILKRCFDIILASLGILLTWWIIIIAFIIATIDTKQNGFFIQKRVGQNGKPFRLIKIRTMKTIPGLDTTVTTSTDPRITAIGKWLRKFKIDELPQLFNVLVGDMSFVGPRPDVPGFADCLEGDDRIILSVRPGITGPATIKYKKEEELLRSCPDPERYNREVIFPDKVRINREYIENYSFLLDIKYIFLTIIP